MMLVRSFSFLSTVAVASVFVIAIAAGSSAKVAAAQQQPPPLLKEGDECGITSPDFVNLSFRGPYRVAGQQGCTLLPNGNEGGSNPQQKENCYCAPDLVDGNRLSSWKWQCLGVDGNGSDVATTATTTTTTTTAEMLFGPAPGKTCPPTVPVPVVSLEDGGSSVSTSQEQQDLPFVDMTNTMTSAAAATGSDAATEDGTTTAVTATGRSAPVSTTTASTLTGVTCDSSIHPTGRPGDAVCPYSNCNDDDDRIDTNDENSSSSAVCACINLAAYGLGQGEEWVCLHSTCDCGDAGQDEITNDNNNSNSAAASATSTSNGPMTFLLSTMLVFLVLAHY